MKKIYPVLLMILVLSAFSCNSNGDDAQPQDPVALINAVSQGTWRISNFQLEGDIVLASEFDGYAFNFIPGGILIAEKGSESHAGQWTVSNDNTGKLVFSIDYDSPTDFTYLDNDWKVQSYTSAKVTLNAGSGAALSVLTFEKN